MAGITERNRQKDELASAGFTLRYIDEWQPKTTLYRHKPSYNVDGEMTGDVGTSVKGVPGSPDYVLRKAKIGLFPWLPGNGCTCKWCVEHNVVVSASQPKAEEDDALQPIVAGKGKRRMGPHYKTS
jgi:hypothetical protein